jgi:hypothetical protein
MESWIGVAMSVIALSGSLYSARNARLAVKDKAEAERAAAKDKLEFDLKVKEMELKSSGTAHRVGELETKVADCEKRHTACEEKHVQINKAHEALKQEVAMLKRRLSNESTIEG